jgi:hypothetical protein
MRRHLAIGNLVGRTRAVLITAVFVVSRCVYFVFGVRFNATSIWTSYQLLPNDLLQHRLLQSLYYLHTQPPGFNLLVGLGLKLDSGHLWLLNVVYLAIGLSIAFGVDIMLRLFCVRPRVALAITTLFVISPSTVLFENYLFYDYPLLLCLVESVVAAGLFLNRPSSRSLICCAAFLVSASLLRAIFHPVAVVAIVAVLVLLARRPVLSKRTWSAVGVVLLIPVLLLAKNAVLFGQPTFSSWVGWNVGRLTTYSIPLTERQHLVAQGRLSKVALVAPFSELRSYESIPGLACQPRPGDPLALTRVTKAAGDDPSGPGATTPNLNNRCFLKIYAKAFHDAIAALVASPQTFVKSEARGYLIYGVAPASDYDQLGVQNLDHVRLARTAEDIVLLTWLLPISRKVPPKHLSPIIALGYSLAVLGFFVAVRRASRHRAACALVDRLALWTGALLVYGIAVSYGFDFRENMRFRYPFDPLAIALACYALRALVTKDTRGPNSGNTTAAEEPTSAALPTNHDQNK